MSHPYKLQKDRAFWDKAVSRLHPLAITDIYERKFDLNGLRIATAGSCFAQHIGRYIKESRLEFIDVEPPPGIMPKALYKSYGYDLYSARYGNIYTARQLLQLLQRALGTFKPVENCWPACDGGEGVVDPFRPSIEPKPFISENELFRLRNIHLNNVKILFERCQVFIFTLGLTEAWVNKTDQAVYPIVPGTRAGGKFDPEKYEFRNFTFCEIISDLELFYRGLHEINPSCKLMLTVSPVSLAATATGDHVAVATMYSKSILRAVAGEMHQKYGDVDYFPSYEIIASPATRGIYLAPDRRSVEDVGVQAVMRYFFAAHCPEGIDDQTAPDREMVEGDGAVSPNDLSDEEKRQLGLICDDDFLVE